MKENIYSKFGEKIFELSIASILELSYEKHTNINTTTWKVFNLIKVEQLINKMIIKISSRPMLYGFPANKKEKKRYSINETYTTLGFINDFYEKSYLYGAIQSIEKLLKNAGVYARY